MLEVFIPYNTLETAILDETELLDILSNLDAPQRGIQVYDMPENWIDDENPVYVYSQELGVDFNDCAEYIKSVISDNEKILEHPCGFFILEESSDMTAQIQSDYGVICQSASQVDTSILSCKSPNPAKTFFCDEYGSWHDVFSQMPQDMPSNCFVIVDRYIFVQDDYLNESLQNILNLLNSALPQKFNGTYQVAVITESNKNNSYDGVSFDTLIQLFEQYIKPHLNRPYNIEFEIIAARPNTEFTKIAHNRRAFSNYYYMESDHGFVAFTSANKVTFEQKLQNLGLFADKGNSNSYHSKKLEQFNDYFCIHNNYDYAKSGVKQSSTARIANRLLSQ